MSTFVVRRELGAGHQEWPETEYDNAKVIHHLVLGM
jgi:hypothetical protein